MAGLVGDGLAGPLDRVVHGGREREAHRAPQHDAVGRRHPAHAAAHAEQARLTADHDHRVVTAARSHVDDVDRERREVSAHARDDGAPPPVAAGERRDLDLTVVGAAGDPRSPAGRIVGAAGERGAIAVQVDLNRGSSVGERGDCDDSETDEEAHRTLTRTASRGRVSVLTYSPRDVIDALTPRRARARCARAWRSGRRRARRSTRGGPAPAPTRSPTRSPRSRSRSRPSRRRRW